MQGKAGAKDWAFALTFAANAALRRFRASPTGEAQTPSRSVAANGDSLSKDTPVGLRLAVTGFGLSRRSMAV